MQETAERIQTTKLSHRSDEPLVDVDEIDERENCEQHFESQYRQVVLYSHKIAVGEDVGEHQNL
jgi:hypothetical protein